MNRTTWIIIIAVLVILGGTYMVSRTPAPNDASLNENTEAEASGRVIFSVTDAAVDMGTISEIDLTVSRVEMQNTNSGWMTVSTTPQTYSLLALNASGESKILASVDARAGTYNQILLVVDKVVVKTKAGVTKEAKLPSGELRINTMVVVNTDSTSSVNFDFLADKSLHMTGNGNYIFAPVVKTESRSNTSASVDASGTVVIGSGRIDSDNTVGMDIDGSVKANFQINAKQKLNIDANNMIRLEGVLQ